MNNRFKCDKCSSYQPIGTKTLKCIDCGKDVDVDSRNMTKDRCDDCYVAYRKLKVRENVKRHREMKKLNM